MPCTDSPRLAPPALLGLTRTHLTMLRCTKMRHASLRNALPAVTFLSDSEPTQTKPVRACLAMRIRASSHRDRTRTAEPALPDHNTPSTVMRCRVEPRSSRLNRAEPALPRAAAPIRSVPGRRRDKQRRACLALPFLALPLKPGYATPALLIVPVTAMTDQAEARRNAPSLPCLNRLGQTRTCFARMRLACLAIPPQALLGMTPHNLACLALPSPASASHILAMSGLALPRLPRNAVPFQHVQRQTQANRALPCLPCLNVPDRAVPFTYKLRRSCLA